MSQIRDATRDTEQFKNVFIELSRAIGNTAYETENLDIKYKKFGKFMAYMNKVGYAAIPMYFRMKNRVEITLNAVGALSNAFKGQAENADNASRSVGFLMKQYQKASSIATRKLTEGGDMYRVKRGANKGQFRKRNILDKAKESADYLTFGAFSGIGKGAMMGASGVEKGINKLVKFAKSDEKRKKIREKLEGIRDKISSKMGKIPWGKIGPALGTFLLFGTKLFLLATVGIGFLILFIKSGALQAAFKSIIKVLVFSFGIAAKGFSLIKDGVMRLYGIFTGEGTLLEDIKGVFLALLEIGGGLLMIAGSILVATLGSVIVGALVALKTTLLHLLERIRDKAEDSSQSIYTFFSKALKFLGIIALFGGFLAASFAASLTAMVPFIAIAIGGLVVAAIGIMLERINPFASGGVTGSGLSLVGEKGPELVKLPQGSRVHSNKDSRKMLSGGATNNITVNVQGRIGASDTELRQIATKVGQMINKEVNRTTSSRGTLG